MGMVRTLGAVTVTPGTPTPALLAAASYPGVVIAASSFSILKGIATIVLSSTLPTVGYNGPNGYPGNPLGSIADIHGGITPGGAPAGGQQVVLWGFTTATYFNGRKITVLDCNPQTNSFRFYFSGHDGDSASDSGNTAPIPVQRYRAIRLECGLANGTDYVYVGDLNVSDSQYWTALSLAGLVAKSAQNL